MSGRDFVATGLDDDKDVVSFSITPVLRKEIEKIKMHFSGLSDAEIYSRAFTLLRMYVEKCDSKGNIYVGSSADEC